MGGTRKIRTHAREGKGTLIGGWRGAKLIQPFMGISVEVSQKLKMQLPHNPAIPLLNVYPKRSKSFYNRDTRIATLFKHYSQ